MQAAAERSNDKKIQVPIKIDSHPHSNGYHETTFMDTSIKR
jgi:hypothetical protein